jgi:acyl-coenzyme A thioesterase PaaI-like protein
MWVGLSRYPGGAWLFSWLLGRMIPYSGTVSASVVELEPGRACVTLGDRRRVRNHLRSIHAIALMNLGELTTGLALNCGLPSSLRAILVGLSMEYTKKARGTITAVCSCVRPTVDRDQELQLTGELRDEAGDVVAVARAVWRVGPAPRRSA